MFKISMRVEGMMCPHCEKHMNDTIKSAFGAKKVTSSHENKTAEFLSDREIPESEILEAVKETGYQVSDIKYEEQKRSFCFLNKKRES